MTARSLDQLWSIPADIVERFERGAGIDAKRLALVDETVALRRCALYRDAFRGTAVSYPAAVLGFDALAAWIRRHGVTVDVTTDRRARLCPGEGDRPHAHRHAPGGPGCGVDPRRRQRRSGKVRRRLEPADRGAGRQRRPDPASRHRCNRPAGGLGSEVLAHPGLELIGLHCKLDDPDDAIGAVKLREMVAAMSGFGASTESSSRVSASPAWNSANRA